MPACYLNVVQVEAAVRLATSHIEDRLSSKRAEMSARLAVQVRSLFVEEATAAVHWHNQQLKSVSKLDRSSAGNVSLR